MAHYIVGQRWMSNSEPELGLGLIESVDRHQLTCYFSGADERRMYSVTSAPLKRVEFKPGDQIRSQSGTELIVESITEQNGILHYSGQDQNLSESELTTCASLHQPEDRLLNGQVDSSHSFTLRYQSMLMQSERLQSKLAGFVGGRVDLIPHQLYIAHTVAARQLPRVLLADEVGLGKTIEACLILHRLHLTGRANRILVIVPDALVHQWFIELMRRFNLVFHLLNATNTAPEQDPFLEQQMILCSLKELKTAPELAAKAIAVNWDLVVVDEAHHLDWSPQRSSPEYSIVEALAAKCRGLLLLTATPAQLGLEGHFARLRLLDPARYASLAEFTVEQSQYGTVANLARYLTSKKPLKKAQIQALRKLYCELDDQEFAHRMQKPQQLLSDLVDRNGTGRVIFRNTREALTGFPQRQAHPVALIPRAKLSRKALAARMQQEFRADVTHPDSQVDFDFHDGPRVHWLISLLERLNPEEKILLICSRIEKVLALKEALLAQANIKLALFHESLSLIQRDRNAAWFSEPDGARILICSEIGSEGRNFQFAHHLVLFDLPMNPELLEQRIGRLDRIGQTETIQIHIPYLENSWTHLMLRWHHEGLQGIENQLRGGRGYLAQFEDRLLQLGQNAYLDTERDESAIQRLIQDTQTQRSVLETSLQKGQASLLAYNSMCAPIAEKLIASIQALDASPDLEAYMHQIFDHFGVTVEELGARTYFLSGQYMFTDNLPGLKPEGTWVTFDRQVALKREEITFITWDHPLVHGAIEIMLSTQEGNAALTTWKHPASVPALVVLEALYQVECVAPKALYIERFLAPSPIRIVVDQDGQDLSQQLSHDSINAQTDEELALGLPAKLPALKAIIRQMMAHAHPLGQQQRQKLVAAAIHRATSELSAEYHRLQALQSAHNSVHPDELQLAAQAPAQVQGYLEDAQFRLDAIRLILTPPSKPA
jgi:ATP-dependent helicase HepA